MILNEKRLRGICLEDTTLEAESQHRNSTPSLGRFHGLTYQSLTQVTEISYNLIVILETFGYFLHIVHYCNNRGLVASMLFFRQKSVLSTSLFNDLERVGSFLSLLCSWGIYLHIINASFPQAHQSLVLVWSCSTELAHDFLRKMLSYVTQSSSLLSPYEVRGHLFLIESIFWYDSVIENSLSGFNWFLTYFWSGFDLFPL